MLNDEQVKNMIYEKSIERFNNNDINEKVLNDVLEYIKNSNNINFLYRIIMNEKSTLFSQIENDSFKNSHCC